VDLTSPVSHSAHPFCAAKEREAESPAEKNKFAGIFSLPEGEKANSGAKSASSRAEEITFSPVGEATSFGASHRSQPERAVAGTRRKVSSKRQVVSGNRFFDILKNIPITVYCLRGNRAGIFCGSSPAAFALPTASCICILAEVSGIKGYTQPAIRRRHHIKS